MVESVTMTAALFATIVATKAAEKTGEKLVEGAGPLVGKFLAALRRKDQSTAAAIEAVAQRPELAEQQPETYSTAMLAAKVEAAAQQDSEIQQTSQAIQTAVYAQPGAIVNITKLAEKIGVVNQGTVHHQNNTISL